MTSPTLVFFGGGEGEGKEGDSGEVGEGNPLCPEEKNKNKQKHLINYLISNPP